MDENNDTVELEVLKVGLRILIYEIEIQLPAVLSIATL